MDYVLTVMLTVNAWSTGWEIVVTTPDAGPTVASQPFVGPVTCRRALNSDWFRAAQGDDPWLGMCREVAVMWGFERPHR